MPDNIKPNLRFATSFLHKKFHKYSVTGEVLQDDMTGEIFVKRNPDNRIISYTQQNKYLHDMMVELRMNMKDNEDYKIPTDPKSAYYVNDYDIQILTGTRFNTLADGNCNLDIDIESSINTNGFFIKPLTRVTDKSYVEGLTSMYNRYFDEDDTEMNPNGINGIKPSDVANEIALSKKEDYKLSNLSVFLEVTVTGIKSDGQTTSVKYDISKNIRFNILNYIPLANVATSVIKTIKRVDIKIKRFDFHKLNMCGNFITGGKYPHEGYRLISSPDLMVIFDRLQISGFVDSVDKVPVGNQDSYNSIAILDNRFMMDHLYMIDKLGLSNSFILANKKPSDSFWVHNNAWVEATAIIRNAWNIVNLEHPTDVKDLEKFIYYNSGTTTRFTLDRTELAHILIAPVNP